MLSSKVHLMLQRHTPGAAALHKVVALLAALAFTCPAHGASSLDDGFAGTALDWCKWEDLSHGATVAQADELVMTTSGNDTFGSSRVLSQARLVSDFDVQVNYRRITGFDAPLQAPPGTFAQLNVAIGMWWDESRVIQFSRVRNSNGEALSVFASSPDMAGTPTPYAQTTAESGILRMVRKGGLVRFLHSTGNGWTEVGSIEAPTTPVFIYLATSNVAVRQSITAGMSRFIVNAGSTDDVNYSQPASYAKRRDFALGGVSENWPAFRYFGDVFTPFDLLAEFRRNGMEWMRVGVTAVSLPELDATPPEHWRSLPWRAQTWGSREYAAVTLRDAAARGMRLYAYLYFSDAAANWGNQTAPAGWAGKSLAETAALVEQHAFDTATYFKSKGLNVEIYEIGNETDIGMVDFLPNRRILVPAGIDFLNDRTWLRDNVWSVQAVLLKAGIAGIRRANPAAKVAVHAASIESGTGPQFGPEFYQAMRDFGVDYDIAALSHPYAQGDRAWKLNQYTTACWFRRVARTVDQIAVPGKPVMIVEASYQSSPVTLVSSPMRDFPFTAQGQADWLREQLRFASNHPSIVGWFWFYPEFWGNITDSNNAAYVLQFGSLLASATQVRPALAGFRVNLEPPSGNTVEYYHAGFDHYFVTADPGEIAMLDGGAFGGAWRRTGQFFMTYANATAGTAPVCRFFSTSFAPKSSHFYTASASECDAVRRNADWQFESVAFHVPLPDSAGHCPAGTIPVYRLYNNGQDAAPNHRFTTDLATEQEFVGSRGFVPEGAGAIGVSMCSPN